ncbi:bifunctional biotin--[acetyl-CoA-carboxylase] ligase/biotin operon repressor BirA [Oceaniserpentilla sp. 4NH20-0058]|uniref:bifunctional biotin--[acetyl-CoA-carboxylase] ligase/biotin operon repressor BirA n=1 Tax=Oceaniserpentilla sp. 4NH20-0058 TaxID=3127660 RepID=UPI003107F68C
MNQALMKILADGQFHSGEELGAALGISRAAIWKQLQKLEALNIPLHSVKGRGYRLPDAVELLEEGALKQAGFPYDNFASVELALSLDSTNNAMMKKAEANQAQRHICFAEMQTSGRGRRGREWLSPFARNLYFSVVWPFGKGIAAIQGLSLAVGLAIHKVVKQHGIEAAGLKWPNDILVKHKGEFAKLGGILIEITGDVTDNCQVVIGVGLNLDVQSQDQAKLDQAAIGLKQLGFNGSRNQLTADIVKELVHVLEAFNERGFTPLQAQWNEADCFHGEPLKVLLPSSDIEGIGRGVNNKGEYQLTTDSGTQVVNAGEVSLRLK